MKIFISHKRNDSSAAEAVARRLRTVHTIDSYLDLIDSHLAKPGEDLGDYLRKELGKCSHLLAVVSTATKESWWVPWEICIATEKDYPLATYVQGPCSLPDYLKKWPYLLSDLDLDKYAKAARVSSQKLEEVKAYRSLEAARRDSTTLFYRNLRAALGQ